MDNNSVFLESYGTNLEVAKGPIIAMAILEDKLLGSFPSSRFG